MKNSWTLPTCLLVQSMSLRLRWSLPIVGLVVIFYVFLKFFVICLVPGVLFEKLLSL